MKVYMPIIIIVMIILCGLHATSQPADINDNTTEHQQKIQTKLLNKAESLDQSQPVMDLFNPVGTSILYLNQHFVVAQSFIPTKNTLTKVELMLQRDEVATHPYTVSIREDLYGPDVTTVSVPANQISSQSFNWVEFNFPDISVIPGQTYYIVSSTLDVFENWYSWGLKIGQNVYPNGTVYVSIDHQENWEENAFADMTFKTYGMDVTELEMSLTGGFGLTVTVQNVGLFIAENVETTITIKGGILGLIDSSFSQETSLLAANDIQSMTANPLGIGPVSITATTQASNAEQISKTVQAFVFVFFVFFQTV
jgi:hypothetical protein